MRTPLEPGTSGFYHPRLAQFELEFVEQPLPMGDIEGFRWLRAQKLGVPIFADENILTSHDVAAHAGAVDGVVIKLAKTGGLRGALRAIHTARALDMQIMLGSYGRDIPGRDCCGSPVAAVRLRRSGRTADDPQRPL